MTTKMVVTWKVDKNILDHNRWATRFQITCHEREVFDETNNDWNAYKEQVEQYFITNGIKEEK